MYLALDVGGTNIKIGFYRELDPSTLEQSATLEVLNDFEKDMTQVVTAVKSFGAVDIKGIGVGLPVTLNRDDTEILSAANLLSWANKGILEYVKRELSCENVHLINDAKAAALSEIIFNNITSDFALVIWGTGVGCTITRYLDGKVPNLQQAEFGHQTITEKITLEGIEYPGSLEYHCGGGHLAQRFGKHAVDLSEGDWDVILQDMSRGIANLLMINYVDTLVFSGGVAVKQSHRLEKLSELVGQKIRSRTNPTYSIAKYGEEAGLVGALGLIQFRADNT